MKSNISKLSLDSIFIVLIIICSKISIPIGPIPVTLQLFAITITSFILPLKNTLICICTYIFLGLIGLPIFSNGGGVSYFFYPSFGFIIGFVGYCILIKIHTKNLFFKYFKYFLAIIILYTIGVFYMYLICRYYLNTTYSFLNIIKAAVLPFIFKDIVIIFLTDYLYFKYFKVLIKKQNIFIRD